jgi:hypothetical protein
MDSLHYDHVLRNSGPTETEFRVWLRRAKAGESFVYHCGFLALGTDHLGNLLAPAERQRLASVAHCVWLAAVHGEAHLLQRRLAENCFEYFCHRAATERRIITYVPKNYFAGSREASRSASHLIEECTMVIHRSVPTEREANGQGLQGDLFTGEWQARPPQRGNGPHVRLTRLDNEKLAVPGMASYAGEGPVGKYCKDCGHFGEVAVQRSPDATEKNSTGCAIYAQHMGHAAPTPRRDIRFCAACKHFVAASESIRRFIVDQTGAVHRVQNFPANLLDWRPEQADTSVASPDAVIPAESI